MYTKYQIAPSKAVVEVDRPIKALFMHIQKPLRITKGNNSHRISPYFFAISICYVNMNVFARFDEILSMTLQVMYKSLFMYIEKPLRITKGNNSHRNGP